MNANKSTGWLIGALVASAAWGFASDWFAPAERVADYRPKGPTHCYRQFNIDWSWIALNPEWIPEFLSEANPAALAEFCRTSNVDGTVVMAVPHHGYCTYDTQVGTRFSGMKGDWFGETIRELHDRKIAAFGYVTLNWNWKFIRENPGRDFIHGKPGEDGICSSKCTICLNAPGYLELVEAYTREVLERYPVDGMRWDILMTAKGCVCDGCRSLYRATYGDELKEWGAAPPGRVDEFYIATTSRAVRRLHTLCKQVKPSVEIWQNSIQSYHPNHLDLARELDIAYNEYGDPFRLLFIRGVANKAAAINGLMNKAPVEPPLPLDWREWRTCLALGGRCYSYYGHKQTNPKTLLPEGAFVAWHREQLAPFYAMVRQIEPWLDGAVPVSEVGVVFSERTRFRFPNLDRGRYVSAMEPIAVAGLQRNAPVEFVNRLDLAEIGKKRSRFKLLVLPLTSGLDDGELAAMRKQVDEGGRLLVAGDALRHDAQGHEKADFDLANELGLRFQRVHAAKELWTCEGKLGPDTVHAKGNALVEVRAVEGETVLFAQRDGQANPLLHVRCCGKGRMAYLASLDAPELTQRAIEWLVGPGPLTVEPAGIRAVLTRQEAAQRWVVHLLDDAACSVEIRRDIAPKARLVAQYPQTGWTCAAKESPGGLRVEASEGAGRLFVLE